MNFYRTPLWKRLLHRMYRKPKGVKPMTELQLKLIAAHMLNAGTK